MVNKKPIGRPQKVNYQIISKLEDSLQYGSTISEACYYAGISRDTFYRYFREDRIFAEKMELARNKLLTIAKSIVIRAIIEGDYESSLWLLEKVVTPSLAIADEVPRV